MPKQYIAELCAIDMQALGDKLKISPIGTVTGLDGRVFEIDGDVVLQRLIDSGLQLVLNVSHAYDGKAAGWFTQFELRDSGIYAALKLNELGTTLLAEQSYKYLSPEYFVDYKSNEVVRIVGVGLVNQPNLLNDALNEQRPQSAHPTSSLQKEQEDPMTDISDPTLKDQLATLTAQNEQLAASNADLLAQLGAVKVDNAIAAGKLTPAKREFALTLDANALDTYLTLEAQTASKTDPNGLQHNGVGDEPVDDCPVLAQLGINNNQE